MTKINELLPLHNEQYEKNTDLSGLPIGKKYGFRLYNTPALDSTPAASCPIRVFNTIQTRTISFHIVHNTV
jgi:hypothetical protein